MFEDEFKKANDSIHAGDELLEKVMRLKNKKKTAPYRYVSAAAAAAVVISASAYALPKLMNKNTDGVISESVTYNGGDDRKSAATKMPVSPLPEKDDESRSIGSHTTEKPKTSASAVPKATVQPTPKATVTPKKSTQAKTAEKSGAAAKAKNDDATAEYAEKPSVTEKPAAAAAPQRDLSEEDVQTQQTNGLKEYSFTAEKEAAPRQKAEIQKKTVVLSVNYTDYTPSNGGAAVAYSAAAKTADYSSEEWSSERYFEYLGTDLFKNITLPEDFAYIGNDTVLTAVDNEGNPLLDNRIFPFEGNNDRYITIITSKNLTASQTYLSDTHYTASDVCGIPAVAIGTEKGYRCYIIINDVSYVINADGISTEELENILASMTEND